MLYPVTAALLASTVLLGVTDAPTTSAAAQPSSTTLTILVAEQYPAITAAVTSFEKSHPTVHIQVQIVSGSAFVPKTLLEVASNNPPDLFQNFGGGLLLDSFVKVGYVANLTTFWHQNRSLTNAYLPSALGAATINKQIYGVPYQGVQPVFFYYNRAAFKAAKISAPPATWKAFLSDITKLEIAGYIPLAQGNDAWAMMMWPEYLALRAGGASAGKAVIAGKPGQSPAVATAGNLSRSLVQQTPFEPGFLGITYDAGEPSELLGIGKAAMELQGSWEFSNIQSKTPQALKSNNIGFFSFPSLGNTPDTSIAGNPSIYLSLAQKSPHKALAEEFLKETLLQPWYSKLLISEGAVPGVKGDLAELQKNAKGPETSSLLTFQYNLLTHASYFQQSWDQAALPAETQTIYSAVSKLFAGELTGAQFAKALNG
jgi:ABC-type glycerol-3-phosphate transport system substrate-binding protein